MLFKNNTFIQQLATIKKEKLSHILDTNMSWIYWKAS
jgi:hypothetical protein